MRLAVQAADVQSRCVDAAREAARAAARDDPRAVALGRRALPGPADITVSRSADTVTVTVTVRMHPAGAYLPGVTITAHATAAVEGSRVTSASGPSP